MNPKLRRRLALAGLALAVTMPAAAHAGRLEDLRLIGSTEIAAAPGAPAAARRDRIADGVISAKVKAALLADPVVEGLDVKVSTQAGVVTLAGDVASDRQLVRALTIAESVAGVLAVSNQLAVDIAKR